VQAEENLRSFLDFEAGAGDKLVRSHGFLPRFTTGSYRDLLTNALGWISG
jgi:hypothetical protein